MSKRVIILSDDSSSDSIPSPSPFSPDFRRARPPPESDNDEEEAHPAPAKRQRLSVLEQQPDNEDEILSEPKGEVTNGETRREGEATLLRWTGNETVTLERERNGAGTSSTEPLKKETNHSHSERALAMEEQNRKSVLEKVGETVAMPQNVSDEDRKRPAKSTATRPPAPPQREDEINKTDGQGTSDLKDEIVSEHVQLPAVPTTVTPLDPLSEVELYKLKQALQFDPNDPDNEWPTEWSGNLSLLSLEVKSPLNWGKSKKGEPQESLFVWAAKSNHNLEPARNLLRYVYNAESTPPTAKRIVAHTYHESMKDPKYDMDAAIKSLSFDPAVLREDGWTTAKSAERVGVTGGPYHIGSRVYWEKWEGVVIAYLHDDDIGDLWKAMWFDGNETFDLEAEELQRARKMWKRKFCKQPDEQPQGSVRFASIAKFTVEGIETGIVMAKTYNQKARHGLFWPARVMHVSEYDRQQSQSRRSSAKQKLQVVFLAPYWNGVVATDSRLALADTLSLGRSAFSSGPLFELETIDISEDTIQPYPYQGEHGLNVNELQVAFRFTGLPKNAFARFLDSNRLALALKTYAEQELMTVSAHSHAAAAALVDTHALAIETAEFPTALLHLPFEHILSNLPHPSERDSLTMRRNEDDIEPIIQLRHIMQAMKPPACWGQETGAPLNVGIPPTEQRTTALTSPTAKRQLIVDGTDGTSTAMEVANIDEIASQYLIQTLSQIFASSSSVPKPLDQLKSVLSRLRQEVASLDELSVSQRRKKTLLFLKACLRTKGQGEDAICSEEYGMEVNTKVLLAEWRKACENIYKLASALFSGPSSGSARTYVISDSRCNEHITSNGCVERPVRLPAALKGCRLAARSTGRDVEFLLSVGDDYMTQAQMKVIGMAHSSSYLKRMREKCEAIEPDTSGVALTEDSNCEGGEDTKGSRGSYTAAVAGVAAAIKGVDMIVSGQCVNAFCATRPPGHHAGRELHPMKAISNGFCILNNAACAALYATTPISDHGPGLKRVCVIDIDVHHGNGTQNILCETYDPRFLYVSLHAGGAHINGYEDPQDEEFSRTSLGSKRKEDGIFPGRCGDTSPHKGVLNIPLGAKVNPQDVGTAIMSRIIPAVNSFAPDLIIVSAGFDAHKNDPLGMGGLSAKHFGHITDVICDMANKCCSGRVLSILEGGYGVPCCRPQKDSFHPSQDSSLPSVYDSSDDEAAYKATQAQQPQLELLDLGSDLPEDMEDQVPSNIAKTLDRCHAEGFLDCVREHVGALAMRNGRS